MNGQTILITGVTGHQGGAVARALHGTEFHLRGLTRKPDSEAAAALANRGIEIVKGFDDEAALRRALAGAVILDALKAETAMRVARTNFLDILPKAKVGLPKSALRTSLRP
jgi:uncharacterized protein YbjT (DUF2867 family)